VLVADNQGRGNVYPGGGGKYDRKKMTAINFAPCNEEQTLRLRLVDGKRGVPGSRSLFRKWRILGGRRRRLGIWKEKDLKQQEGKRRSIKLAHLKKRFCALLKVFTQKRSRRRELDCSGGGSMPRLEPFTTKAFSRKKEKKGIRSTHMPGCKGLARGSLILQTPRLIVVTGKGGERGDASLSLANGGKE